MITKEELDKMIAEYVEARKRYEKIKHKLRTRVEAVTEVLNNIGCDIGDLEYSIEEFDIGDASVSTKCGRSCYGEYSTEYRSFPLVYLLYDPTNKDGCASDEWKNIRELEEERIKKQREKEAEEKRIRLEKEEKAKRKRALLNKKKREERERAEYERLKAKFGKEAHV